MIPLPAAHTPHAPRPPAAGHSRRDERSRAPATDTTCTLGPHPRQPHSHFPALTSVSREKNRPPGRSSTGRSTWTPALLPACPKAAGKRHKNGHIDHLTSARFFRDVNPLPPPAEPGLARRRSPAGRASGENSQACAEVALPMWAQCDSSGTGHRRSADTSARVTNVRGRWWTTMRSPGSVGRGHQVAPGEWGRNGADEMVSGGAQRV